jgi:hypothetical protein
MLITELPSELYFLIFKFLLDRGVIIFLLCNRRLSELLYWEELWSFLIRRSCSWSLQDERFNNLNSLEMYKRAAQYQKLSSIVRGEMRDTSFTFVNISTSLIVKIQYAPDIIRLFIQVCMAGVRSDIIKQWTCYGCASRLSDGVETRDFLLLVSNLSKFGLIELEYKETTAPYSYNNTLIDSRSCIRRALGVDE